jgi:hypothetical protein
MTRTVKLLAELVALPAQPGGYPMIIKLFL